MAVGDGAAPAAPEAQKPQDVSPPAPSPALSVENQPAPGAGVQKAQDSAVASKGLEQQGILGKIEGFFSPTPAAPKEAPPPLSDPMKPGAPQPPDAPKPIGQAQVENFPAGGSRTTEQYPGGWTKVTNKGEDGKILGESESRTDPKTGQIESHAWEHQIIGDYKKTDDVDGQKTTVITDNQGKPKSKEVEDDKTGAYTRTEISDYFGTTTTSKGTRDPFDRTKPPTEIRVDNRDGSYKQTKSFDDGSQLQVRGDDKEEKGVLTTPAKKPGDPPTIVKISKDKTTGSQVGTTQQGQDGQPQPYEIPPGASPENPDGQHPMSKIEPLPVRPPEPAPTVPAPPSDAPTDGTKKTEYDPVTKYTIDTVATKDGTVVQETKDGQTVVDRKVWEKDANGKVTYFDEMEKGVNGQTTHIRDQGGVRTTEVTGPGNEGMISKKVDDSNTGIETETTRRDGTTITTKHERFTGAFSRIETKDDGSYQSHRQEDPKDHSVTIVTETPSSKTGTVRYQDDSQLTVKFDKATGQTQVVKTDPDGKQTDVPLKPGAVVPSPDNPDGLHPIRSLHHLKPTVSPQETQAPSPGPTPGQTQDPAVLLERLDALKKRLGEPIKK